MCLVYRSMGRRRVMVPLVTRILLADDHTLVREGLRMVLDAQPDLQVVAEAGDGPEAIAWRCARTSTSRSSTWRCPG